MAPLRINRMKQSLHRHYDIAFLNKREKLSPNLRYLAKQATEPACILIV